MPGSDLIHRNRELGSNMGDIEMDSVPSSPAELECAPPGGTPLLVDSEHAALRTEQAAASRRVR
jgi:hypothetical protein